MDANDIFCDRDKNGDSLFLKMKSLNNMTENGYTQNVDLIEQRLYLAIKLKSYKDAVYQGLQLLRVLGPRPNVFKCIIVGLCRSGKYEECLQILEQWKQIGPKDPVMLECKHKIEGLLSALLSGVNPEHVLGNLEEAIGLVSLNPTYFQETCQSRSPVFELSSIERPFSAVLPRQNSSQNFRSLNSPLPFKSRSTNPAYLTKLIKLVNSTPAENLTSVLADELEGVRIKCFGEVDVKLDVSEHRWEFAIASRDALRTVSLLNDANRENFFISGACFYYDQSSPLNLMTLHQSNSGRHLQVLNTFVPLDCLINFGGWPSSFCYKIEITFRGFVPSLYHQTVIFDFKREPKVLRHISAEVEVQHRLECDKPNFNPDNFTQLFKELEINNSYCDLPAIPIPWSTGLPDDKGSPLAIDLNRSNYVLSMGKMLNHEMNFLQNQLRKHNEARTMKLVKSYIVENKFGNEIKLADERERFLIMDIGSDLGEDSIFGKLLKKHCNSVLINHLNGIGNSYTCKIKEKLHNKWIISLDFNQIQDLGLQFDYPYNFRVEFVLDIFYFEECKRLLAKIGDIELQILFPDVARKITSEVDTFNGILQEGLCTLNPRQVDAYNLITNTSLALAYVPPVILIGPTGSGKTTVLTESIKKILTSQPTSRILICTHSDTAANKFAETIDEWIKFGLKTRMIRVYNSDSKTLEDIPITIKPYCTLSLDYKLRLPFKEEIQQVNIVITTIDVASLLSRENKVDLGKYYFSHIIIDEAGEVLEVDLMAPFVLANPNTRVVLSGDHLQDSFSYLSSISTNTNILERLNTHYPNDHSCKIVLTENYNSHSEILKFASEHFFPFKLRCNSIQPTHPSYFPLSFFCVEGEETQTESSVFNLSEISQISNIIQNLVLTWPKQWGKYQDPNSIIVLTTYEEQVLRTRNQLRALGLGFVTVEGIWNLRASQFRVVILSTVKTQKSIVDNNFLTNSKLMYMALTRAQSLFAVVGDPLSLCTYGSCWNIWSAFIKLAAHNQSNYSPELTQIIPPSNGNFPSGRGKAVGYGSQRTVAKANTSASINELASQPNNSSPVGIYKQFAFNISDEFIRQLTLTYQESKPGVNTQGVVLPALNGKFQNGNINENGMNKKSHNIQQSLNKNMDVKPVVANTIGLQNNHKQIVNRPQKQSKTKTNGKLSSLETPKAQQKEDSTTKPMMNLDHLALLHQSGKNSPSDDKVSSNDWVEVKKTKKTKQNNNSNLNNSSSSNSSTPGEKSTDEKIKLLTEMGYERKRAIRALQNSNRDLDKAIDFLLSGPTQVKSNTPL